MAKRRRHQPIGQRPVARIGDVAGGEWGKALPPEHGLQTVGGPEPKRKTGDLFLL